VYHALAGPGHGQVRTSAAETEAGQDGHREQEGAAGQALDLEAPPLVQ
jgi:hypothetical protein